MSALAQMGIKMRHRSGLHGRSSLAQSRAVSTCNVMNYHRVSCNSHVVVLSCEVTVAEQPGSEQFSKRVMFL